ncbi:MAG TPA: cysteine rich repeat-containing protein [Pseudolabrys sp.]|nr:cysteine rich repeat-containing protein [Pseudolabrys sp.]
MVQLQNPVGRRLGRVRSTKTRLKMLIRRLTAAFLLSLAAISFPGSILAAQAATPLALCKADAERICPGIAPGGGKIIGCLKQHKDEVSVGCAKALKALKAKRRA